MDLISNDFFLILITIVIFTVIQSIFGVGLLVFGTPTLILLGFSFYDTLSYLLPSSILVSLLQVYKNSNRISLYRKIVFLYCLPMVIIGLFTIIYISKYNFNLLVSLMLILMFIFRISENLRLRLEKFLSKNYKSGFLIMGLVHGFTNLGGAFLVIITNGLYKSKLDIQSNIAYVYMFMALIQLLVLQLTGNLVVSGKILAFPIVSGFVFWNLGRFIFEKTSNKLYYNLMTFFILIYGLLLFFKEV
tara:strand:+ start:159 stop:896 length:738 start_codon:yes stop_codon:yes gene_type:complete